MLLLEHNGLERHLELKKREHKDAAVSFTS